MSRFDSRESECALATPLRLGLTGAGGFATFITDLLLRSGAGCQPPIQLVSVAEPNAAATQDRLALLREHGIEIVDSAEELFRNPFLEAIWLPLPIHLHRPFAEQALAAGKSVLVEKPAAGTVQDIDAMIAARDRARLPVSVAFQHMSDPLTAQLKRRLVSGELGTLQHAVLHACWPRTEEYYRRSNWVGRIKINNAWVMDSPPNNALAHYLNLALFFLGESFLESAAVEKIEAELYRAHDIETFDTISLRVHLTSGASLLVLLTHACRDYHDPVIRVEGTRGHFTWKAAGVDLEVAGRTESIPACPDPERRMVEQFAKRVRGFASGADLECSLEIARNQVLVTNAACEATPIFPIPPHHIERFACRNEVGVAVPGIEVVVKECVRRRCMLHESGLLSFTQPARTLSVRGYQQFKGLKTLPTAIAS